MYAVCNKNRVLAQMQCRGKEQNYLPGVAVALDTVVQHYQAIWREPMPNGELNSLNKRFKMIRGTL